MRLEVSQMPDEIAHQGIAVLSQEDLSDLNIQTGSAVSVRGGRLGRAIIRTSPEASRGSIYLDATTRLNCSCRVGDSVEITPLEKPRSLKGALLAPIGEEMDDDLEDFVGRNLYGRILGKGDHITFPSPGGGVLELQIEKLRPLGARINGGVVEADTEIRIAKRPARKPLLETGDVSFADIGGMDSIIEKIQEVAVVPLLHPEIFIRGGKPPIRGVLLHGEPGTGKSLLARALARETRATFHSVSAPEVLAGLEGTPQETLRQLFIQAKNDEPAVVFIDEIDAIAPDRHRSSECARKLVAQLLVLMDGMNDRGQVVVIGATNRLEALDPAVIRSGRFERVIECEVPDRDGRLEILEVHTRAMPLSEEVDIEEIADLTVGFVGADIDHICREAVYRAANRAFGFDRLLDMQELEASEMEITPQDMLDAFDLVRPSIKRKMEREVEKTGFESIIGQEEAKDALKEKMLRPLEFPELHEAAELKIGSGILLHGPPGTGKTQLARACASIAGAQFLSVKGPELLSMWQGESERAARNLFDKARKMSPCILFFDEFDSLGVDRGKVGPGHSGLSSIVNQILTEMDGIDSRDGILTIAATNRKDLIDPAFLREGRLGTHVEVSLPNKEEYPEIIGVHLGGVKRSEDVDLDEQCSSLPLGLSGADLSGIAVKAREMAVKRHLLEHPDGETAGFQIEECDIENAISEKSTPLQMAALA